MSETLQDTLEISSFGNSFYRFMETDFCSRITFEEDAFIVESCAKLYWITGVIGFNGETKISASTTHLYVFVLMF